MKLLYIITQGENGGAQKNVFDLATFANDKFEVTVATGEVQSEKDNWLKNKLLENGFESSQLYNFKNLIRNISPIHDLKAFLEIYNYIKKENFDIVHLHSSKAGVLGSLAGKLAGAKVVYTVHGFVFQEPMSILKKYFYIFAEILSSFFIDYHICVSQKDLKIGEQKYILRDPKRYNVIYNGINANANLLLEKDAARKFITKKIEQGLDEDDVIFGTIANLYVAKGLTYYVQAAKILKEKVGEKFVCVIFGEGKLHTELENKIKELGLDQNFYLLGRTENAVQYLPGLDAFVLPSVKEGLPYALVEATLAELPIIATNVGGIPEMSRNFKMNLVEAKNPQELSDEMLLLTDKQARNAAKSSFNEIFSLNKMAEKTLEVYRKLSGNFS
jgi:glycosyltransferase involved in cell wall biosynthesis